MIRNSIFSISMCISLLSASAAGLAAGESPDIKLINGCEPSEMDKLYLSKRIIRKPTADGFSYQKKSDNWSYARISKRHATQGDYSWVRWRNSYLGEKAALFNTTFFGMNWIRRARVTDWSGWDYLWLDVTIPKHDGVIRMLFEDDSVFSPIHRFKIPAGKTVTLSIPLKKAVELARLSEHGELKLEKIHSLYAWIESVGSKTRTKGFKGSNVYVDNLRLARKKAPKPAALLEAFQILPADYGWAKKAKALPPVPKRSFPRKKGPVEQLGPVHIKLNYRRKPYMFGGPFGTGGDYGSNLYRNIAAYDNDRILLVVDTNYVIATFDGGKTWKGIDGKPGPTMPGCWSNHAGAGASGLSGDAYIMVRSSQIMKADKDGSLSLQGFRKPACNSGGNVGILTMKLIRFRGDKWELGPEVLVDHHVRHCPGGPGTATLQLASGRLWSFWHSDHNLQGGIHINGKYSDDNGITWKFPGRYPSTQGMTRMFSHYYFAFPYKNHVALLWNQRDASLPVRWSRFDGKTFSPQQTVAGRANAVSVASLPDGNAFVALRPLRRKQQKLYIKRFDGKAWKDDATLDEGTSGGIGSVSMTRSGGKIYCFWHRVEKKSEKKVYRVLYSCRGASSAWSKPITITRQSEPIHRIVTPDVSPDNFVPLFWDCAKKGGARNKDDWHKQLWVRFARVPSDKAWDESKSTVIDK